MARPGSNGDAPRFAVRAWVIALAYALFAGLWILFSDLALATVVRDADRYVQWSVYKGTAFVLITSVLLFLLIRRAFGQIEAGYRSHRQTAAIVSGQNAVLSIIANGGTLEASLTALVQFLEVQSPGTRCSVLLLDDDGVHLRHGAAPSLPPEYTKAIDGSAIGLLAGSCGTAAFTRESVFVEDIAADARWAHWQHFALPHGLRACWSTPIFDAQQRVLGTFAIYRDTPSRPTPAHLELIAMATQLASVAIGHAKVAGALQESEARFHAFMDASPAIAWVTDEQGRHVYMNRGWSEAFGLDRDELIGRTAADLVPADVAERIRLSDVRVLADGPVTVPEEYGVLRGEPFVWNLYKFPFRNGAGQRFVGGIALDITQRKRTEAALREVEGRVQVVVENLREGLVIADPDGAFMHWNPASLRILGFDDPSLIHEQQFALHTHFALSTMDGAALPLDQWPLARVRRGESLQDEELVVRRLHGEWQRTLSYSGALVDYADGHQLAFFTVQDITDRKRAERELRESRDRLEDKVAERTFELSAALVRAESADRIKSAFLATMSHELRTPLNSIIGFTGILLQRMAGPIKTEQEKQLSMVRGSARHLLALINDVLDLSKIEAGQLEVLNERVEVPALVERVVASVRPLADSRGLSLEITMTPDVGTIDSDQRRVAQILLNLLNNAVKFTVEGTVSLDVTPVEMRAEAGTVPALQFRVSGHRHRHSARRTWTRCFSRSARSTPACHVSTRAPGWGSPSADGSPTCSAAGSRPPASGRKGVSSPSCFHYTPSPDNVRARAADRRQRTEPLPRHLPA